MKPSGTGSNGIFF
jgi:hypothetical protein